MDTMQFKAMLALYGADIKRWDGVCSEDVRVFMAGSEEARKLYEEAGFLDAALSSFVPGDPDPEVLRRVMRRIGAEPGGGAEVLPFRRRERAGAFILRNRTAGWGLAAACAAVVLLALPFAKAPEDHRSGDAPSAKLAAASGVAEGRDADVNVLLATLDTLAEESVEEQEIIGLWQVVAARGRSAREQDVETFLDDLFANGEEPPDDMDLWDLFLAADTLDL